MARFAIVMLDQLLNTGEASDIPPCAIGAHFVNVLHLCGHMCIPPTSMVTSACHARMLEHVVLLRYLCRLTRCGAVSPQA
jgi:hypothetical protein